MALDRHRHRVVLVSLDELREVHAAGEVVLDRGDDVIVFAVRPGDPEVVLVVDVEVAVVYRVVEHRSVKVLGDEVEVGLEVVAVVHDVELLAFPVEGRELGIDKILLVGLGDCLRGRLGRGGGVLRRSVGLGAAEHRREKQQREYQSGCSCGKFHVARSS